MKTRLPCILAAAAKRNGAAAAIIHGNEPISYATLEALVRRTEGKLQAAGVGPRDKAALILPNCPEYLVLLFALWRRKAAACLINPQTPPEGIKRQVGFLSCRQIIRRGPACRSPAMTSPGTHSLRFLEPDRPAVVILTSGTTAHPKAVVLNYGNLFYNAEAANGNIRIAAGDRWLLSLPLFHVSGLGVVFRAFLAGAAVVIPESGEELGRSLSRYQATHVSVVSTQLQRLLSPDRHRNDFSALKAVLWGGGPLSLELREKARRAGLPVYCTYGLSETASQVATSSTLREKDYSLKVLKNCRVKIAPDGEINVRGKTLFPGYLEAGGRVRRPLGRTGWFATGDCGRWVKKGFLQVTGRKDSMFVSGGEKVYPEEIEGELLSCAGVRQAVVLPRPDPEFGCRPVAFIAAGPRQVRFREFTRGLKEALAKKLPSYKMPVAFYPLPEDCGGPGIKPSRQPLRDYLTRLEGRQRGASFSRCPGQLRREPSLHLRPVCRNRS